MAMAKAMDQIIPFDAYFPLPFRAVSLVGMGILGWATNLHGLEALGIDAVAALDLGIPDGAVRLPFTTHRLFSYHQASTFYIPIYRLFMMYTAWCFITWTFFVYLIRGSVMLVDAFSYIPALCVLCIVVVLISEVDAFQKLERDVFLSAARRCLFPSSDKPVHFSDVVLADIFTSFAKVFGDVWLSICMLLPGGSILNIPRQEGWVRWILPSVMSLPYLLRLRQCLIEYNTTPRIRSRWPLYNALKYASSFPVIFLSAALRIFPDSAGEDGSKAVQGTWRGDIIVFRLWLLAAAVNSLYSFWWDVTNDWGLELLNPSDSSDLTSVPPRRLDNSPRSPRRAYPWGLRSKLLLPLPIYPLLIFLNLVLRLTWSVKLSSHLHSDPDGSAAIFWLEIAELVRRWMWVFLRVEWEIVRRMQEGGGEQMSANPVDFDAEEYELVVDDDDDD